MKYFMRKWKSILAGLILLGLVAAGTPYVIERVKAASAEADEYPDAPFRPVGKDFPRIIPVKSNVPFKDSDQVRRFLLNSGAIRKASAEEREVINTVVQGNYVKGREQAEKILENSPASVPALIALAIAEFRGEAHLPRALFHVRQARKFLEHRGAAKPDDADGREWYLRALDLEYHILRDLGQPGKPASRRGRHRADLRAAPLAQDLAAHEVQSPGRGGRSP